MFGTVTSKKDPDREALVETTAQRLFTQITDGRDEAKSGGVVDEQVFNERLNSMFVAGYLIGYVDTCLAAICEDEAAKKEAVEQVFEKMFPGSGVDFIKTRVIARRQASTIAKDHEQYAAIIEQCSVFDAGMESAKTEVEKLGEDGKYSPLRLKEYLLLGEV